MARPRNKLVDYLQYLGLRLFEMFLHMFDVQRNYRTARWVGEVLWRLLPKYRRIAGAPAAELPGLVRRAG